MCLSTQSERKNTRVLTAATWRRDVPDSFVYVGFSHVLKVIPYLLLDSILQLTLKIKVKCENARKIAKNPNENGRTLHSHGKRERGI